MLSVGLISGVLNLTNHQHGSVILNAHEKSTGVIVAHIAMYVQAPPGPNDAPSVNFTMRFSLAKFPNVKSASDIIMEVKEVGTGAIIPFDGSLNVRFETE